MLIINNDPWYTAPVTIWVAPIPTMVKVELTNTQRLIDKHVLRVPFATQSTWSQAAPHSDGIRPLIGGTYFRPYQHKDNGYSQFFTDMGFTDLFMFGYSVYTPITNFYKKNLCEQLVSRCLTLSKQARTNNIGIFPGWEGPDFVELLSWMMSEIDEDLHLHLYNPID